MSRNRGILCGIAIAAVAVLAGLNISHQRSLPVAMQSAEAGAAQFRTDMVVTKHPVPLVGTVYRVWAKDLHEYKQEAVVATITSHNRVSLHGRLIKMGNFWLINDGTATPSQIYRGVYPPEFKISS